jgi:hypothetical protein
MTRLPALAAAALVTLVLPATPVRAAMDGDALPGIGTQRAVKAPVLDTICLLVEAAAVANGLPISFFARLINQESSFRPAVEGPMTRYGVRAQGIAQFMPGTAAERGLLDPFDPVQALPRSAEFLKSLEARFGNLGLAAAAYNAGPGRIEGVLRGVASVPAETRGYVASITGHTIEDWIAARRDGEVLVPPHGGTCSDVRAGLAAPGRSAFMTALEKRVEDGVAKPWGVQLSAGFMRARALASYAGAERRFAAILAGRDPMILRTVLRNRGTRAFYQVRAGADTRAEAETLCQRLRKAGGACLVLGTLRAARRG